MKIALLTCSRAQHLVRIRPFLAHASSNGADGISDTEGKAAREAASECGQRASFNGANGMSDPAAAIFSCAQPLSITITFRLS